MKRLLIMALLCSPLLAVQADEIHWAARKNKVGTINKLLKGNPNLVHERDLRTKRTPLHVAAEFGSLDVAKILIAEKANVNAVTKGEGTPLDVAAAHGQTEFAELLIEHGAEADTFTYAALGQTDKALATEDLNARDENGATPLFLATQNGHLDTVKQLLIKKADPTITNNEEVAPLELATAAGQPDLVKQLLAGGADPNYATAIGRNMLHLAPDVETATIFLAFEADVNQADEEGARPLHHAIAQRNPALIELLLQFKAEVNAVDHDGLTPLHLAARYDHAPIAELLINHHADPNATAKNGDTPLHACAKSKAAPKIVPKLLLQHGAKVNALNEDKQTPLDLEEAAIKQWIGLGLDEEFISKVHATANLYIKQGGKNGKFIAK